jgi:hypothetical protein
MCMYAKTRICFINLLYFINKTHRKTLSHSPILSLKQFNGMDIVHNIKTPYGLQEQTFKVKGRRHSSKISPWKKKEDPERQIDTVQACSLNYTIYKGKEE